MTNKILLAVLCVAIVLLFVFAKKPRKKYGLELGEVVGGFTVAEIEQKIKDGENPRDVAKKMQPENAKIFDSMADVEIKDWLLYLVSYKGQPGARPSERLVKAVKYISNKYKIS